ncbi:MAG: 2-dehydro-3-deoxyphosphogluconate aldolase/(4S)-4-hydroxy-2-oxoglutarate aldolase [Bermanella sp.]|jgi:2-dehydro-3-deoxyphosphogluconate aldolase/(4S)-4-hydroxy-2-oxoglutarate aldolase
MNSRNELMPSARNKIAQQIISYKLIAIIRLHNSCSVQATLNCLVQGGVRALEITSNTPDFCLHIELARQQFPTVLVGAGTILNSELAKQAIAAGAQFLVTPNVNADVVQIAHANNIPVLMGATTPTEIANAIAYGADIVKLFPANALSIDYYQALKGPFADTPMFAVGGISPNNTSAWLSSGIQGVGVGSELAKEIISQHAMTEHIRFIKQFIESIY